MKGELEDIYAWVFTDDGCFRNVWGKYPPKRCPYTGRKIPSRRYVDAQWKETVRDIFDALHSPRHSSESLLEIIAKRHYDFFYKCPHEPEWGER